jgi:flagellar biosynthetic protein FlhB
VTPYRLQLNLQLFAGEKTESATPKKRQEAREKGQVAKSMELPAAFILLSAFLALYMLGSFMKDRITRIFSDTYNHNLLMDITITNVNSLFYKLLIEGLILLSPIFVVTLLIAILGNYLQIGFLMTLDPLKMKLSKLNPIEGAKRIFSLRAVIDFVKSMFKMLIIGIILYLTLWGEKEKLLALGTVPLEQTVSYISSLTLTAGIKIGVTLAILAVFDFIYQKYEHEKSLKMSKQDILDEYKKSEGDPLIKGKIKERQRKLAMQRMMQEIPKADVIITNPTHYAVALKYDSTNMQAPTVIAKGTDYIALKIKEIAKSHQIVTMENKPLARSLYAQVEIGQSIPADLFQAVAEVLAYVYKMKGKGKARPRRIKKGGSLT